MIYFGDGETDVPCMKLIKQLGGTAVAVYEPGNSKKKDIASTLLKQQRVNYVCEADYSKGKNLNLLIEGIIDKIKADEHLLALKKRFE